MRARKRPFDPGGSIPRALVLDAKGRVWGTGD
jgi:hypothetical protein